MCGRLIRSPICGPLWNLRTVCATLCSNPLACHAFPEIPNSSLFSMPPPPGWSEAGDSLEAIQLIKKDKSDRVQEHAILSVP